jgi:NAD(P)H-hydrate epimerase
MIAEEWAVSVVPRRHEGAHKWGVGGVVVVAGSPPFAGAAALCCAGAGRSGAGIVSAALPRSIAHVVVGLVPEVTVVPLPDGETTSVALRAAEAIGQRLERSQALVVGPGLGDDEAAQLLMKALFGFTTARGGIGFGTGGSGSDAGASEGPVAAAGKPVVMDADALNWLAGQEHWWERLGEQTLVLTPHAGEMARLVKSDVAAVLKDPVAAARDAAKLWGQTVVLKANRAVVATATGETLVTEAPPALATAGSGDVLSGSIAALLAQGLEAPDAAALALFVGSRAARRVADRYGTLGVVASDLPTAIAEELRELEIAGG